MTIAIVIGTHGWAAEQLLEKYNAQLAKLDTTKGVLFLVDTWGGSPFNAASRIVVDKEHYEVIAGVNIPMLVETLMARDDDPSFDELVAVRSPPAGPKKPMSPVLLLLVMKWLRIPFVRHCSPRLHLRA